MGKKGLLLVRVSTHSQDFEAQKKELIKYAKKIGYTDLHISENKESAIKLNEAERKGIQEMKEYLEKNDDCKDVFVWELSRLARTESVLHSIKEYLVSRKINLHILSENITLLNELGEETQTASLLFSFYGHIASQEMKIKVARSARAKKDNAEKGKFSVGNKVKLGYKKDDNKYLVIDDDSSKIVKLIFELYSTGKYSIKELQSELLERGIELRYDRIRDILKDVTYVGKANKRNKVFKNYPQIIDEELFNKVKEIKKQNMSKKSKESVNKKLALKILRCHKCGSAFGYNGCSTYECYKRKYYKTLQVEKCDSDSIESKVMDEILFSIGKRLEIEYRIKLNEISKKETLDKIEVLNTKINACYNRLSEIEEEKNRLVTIFLKKHLTEKRYDEMYSQLEANVTNENNRIKNYKDEISTLNNILSDIVRYDDDVQKFQLEYFKTMKTTNDVVTIEDDKRIYELVHKHIKSAYIQKFECDGKEYKCICVNSKYSEMFTYIYDFKFRKRGKEEKHFIKYVELTNDWYNDFSVNESYLEWETISEEMKKKIVRNTIWIKEQMKNNFYKVRLQIKSFQEKVKFL